MGASALMVGVALMVGIGLAAAPAGAEETSKKAADVASNKKKDDNYGYVFTDDLLNAPSLGANAATITVLPLGRRDRLLRPRVHFVPEMLKSVETM